MEGTMHLLSKSSLLSALSFYLALWAKHYYYHTHLISKQNKLERDEVSQLISNGNGIVLRSFWIQILVLWSSCITNCHFAYLVYQDNFLRKGCLFWVYLSLSVREVLLRLTFPKTFVYLIQTKNQLGPLNCFYHFQMTLSIFCLLMEEEWAIQRAQDWGVGGEHTGAPFHHFCRRRSHWLTRARALR